MLTKLKRAAVFVVPLTAVALLFLGGALTRIPVPADIYQQCLQATQRDKAKEAKCKATETLWERSFTDPIAYYTLWLTAFTGLLGATGIAQWVLISRQIKLASDEFSATHRPKIFVQTVVVTDKGQRSSGRYRGSIPQDIPKPARGIITVVNGGDSPAFLIEWRSAIYFQSTDAAFAPHLISESVQRPKPDAPGISPGEWQEILHEQIHAVDRDWEEFVNEGGRMFFLGRITYEGADKIRRNTGFCREYDKVTEGRWKSVKDSEHEYSY